MTTATHTLDIFRAEIGVRESPAGSNRTVYGERYGFNGVPWCAIFVSDCLARAGLGAQYRFAAVASGVADSKRRGTHRTTPQVGDLCNKLYTATSGHIGIVEAVHADGTITSIEGNTSGTNDANGGMVMRRRRSLSFWNAGYIRIKYADLPEPSKPIYGADISHHQGTLTVSAIAGSGVAYLWHKATEGGSFVDGQYLSKRLQATMVGIPFGAYDFVRPHVDPVKHARWFYDHAEYHIPGMLRPAMDIEVPGITPAWLSTYRAEVERLFGVVPCAYVATSIYQEPGIPQALAGCPLWVPRYNAQPPVIPWDVWQYTDARPPFGIDGNVTHRLERVVIPKHLVLGPITVHPYPEDRMKRFDLTMPLDDQGCGWRDVPTDRDPENVVSIVVNAADPPGNGYRPTTASRLNVDGKTRVVVTGGPPRGEVGLDVWVAD